MSIPEHVDTPLEDIQPIYDRIHARFASHATQSLDYRIYNLKQLAYLIIDNETRIQAAVKKDLQCEGYAVQLGELFPPLGEIDLAVKRLPTWMKDESRSGDALLGLKGMKPRVVKQPKGVALIIGPWNYPWNCNLGPLVGAISAGCPAVIKPSELAPSSAELMAELIPRYLDPEAYAVVLGGIPQSTALLEREWGHILYTGSGNVGKIVAGAAAKTLTPSTLELGGKSPVIVSSCADVKITARRMMSIKQLTIGQMCVCPDYILCAKDRLDDFVKACTETLDEFFPPDPSPNSLLNTGMSGGLVGDRHYDRQLDLLEKAQSDGKVIYRGETDKSRRRMGISLVKLNELGQGESGGLIEDEIFGPVLPIIPVEDVDAAIRYINARPKPLALYVCSTKRSVFLKAVEETVSGSAIWNDFATTPLCRHVPFGGVGASGWGSYHGYDGFKTFTHMKATMEVGLNTEMVQSFRYPPMTNFGRQVMSFLLSAGVQFSRPVSVEHEKKLRERRRLTRFLVWAVGFGVVAWLGVLARDKMIR